MPRGVHRSPKSARAFLVLLGILWTIAVSGAACAQKDHPATPPPRRAAPEAGGITAPLPLDPLRRPAGAAFRSTETAGAFTGGGPTYAVRAAAGAFELAPIHHPRKGRAAAALAEPVRGEPIRMETTRIARGERAIAGSQAPVARVADDGHLITARGPVEEHLRNLPEGVELSFGFAAAPSGEGDLVVEVAISGQAPAGETHAGLHFKDSATGLGVRVGRATWIDGRGRETSVPLRATAAGLELRVPAEVLASSAYPALLDPVISPEIGMDAPVLGPSTDSQLDAFVAFDGTQHLVAWTDYRPHSGGAKFARVDASGALLDPVGVHIASGAVKGVAQGGGVFFVLYSVSSPSAGLRGALVDSAGVISADFPISAQNKNITGAAVAFDGTQFMTAWEDSTGQMYRARVSTAGVVLDAGGVATLSADSTFMGLAAHGAGVLLVHMSSSEQLMGARIDPGGTVLDPAGFLINDGPAWGASAAFDGTNYVVGWYNQVGSPKVLAARVSPQGAVLDPAGIAIYEEMDPDRGLEAPRLVSDGASTLVIWSGYTYEQSGGAGSYARLSPQGAVLTPAPVMVTENGFITGGVASGSDVFLVWSAWREPIDQTIVGGRVSPQDELLAPLVTISKSANGQQEPAAAFDGQNFVVTWSDDRSAGQNGLWDIRAARISPAGENVDATSIPIHTPGQQWEGQPRASFDGVNTVIAWWDCSAFLGDGDWWCYGRAARLSPQGSLLDATSAVFGFDDTHMPYPMAISSGAGSTLLGGIKDAEAVHVGFLSGAGVPSNLTSVTGDNFTVSWAPASAFDGKDHLLVWSEDRGTGRIIYGTRVSSSGVLLDGWGVPLVPSAVKADQVAIAWNGTHHLLVWRERGNGAMAIRAQRLTPQLQPVDVQGIDVAANLGCNEVRLDSKGVVWDGQRWVLVWQGCGPNSADILGAEISDAGVVLSSFSITEDAYADGTPSLATTGNGVTLVVYGSERAEAPLGTSRVFARIVGGPACSSDADCNGGVCQAGVCTPSGAGGGGMGGSGGTGGGMGGSAGMGGAGTGGGGVGPGGMGGAGTGGEGPTGSGGGATSEGAGGSGGGVPSDSGCSAAGGSSSGSSWAPLLLAIAWGALRSRRRSHCVS
ncbi:MYXO-CTERM sorting domain-containing protein [Polyangium aurulentum]|uniref:MYXO-CTERM sorting domain-containing protein n=1 Tax=Polyangium aurulentum TaxID=2567896 RepID=UPI00146F14CB|nr:MYXO-CTERM sorting domain-containing protein [Polyangium aurulentum]UQA58388.1 hypothetical protein E8A73_045280 [Polyangium aurulentum]